MPRAPILNRQVFFERLNNRNGLRMFDWAVVTTELGTAVEPVSISSLDLTSSNGTAGFNISDVTDQSFNSINVINPDEFITQYGTGGGGQFREYNI